MIFLIAVSCFQLVVLTRVNKVVCEYVNNLRFNWGSPQLTHLLKTCLMDETTTIDEENKKISTYDETVTGLFLRVNRKISFLPIDVAENFPNLEAYNAVLCSITKISKRNFKDLSKLKAFYLYGNQIEKIPTDALNDLNELEFLSLSKNKLILIIFLINFCLRCPQNKVLKRKCLCNINKIEGCLFGIK